MVRGFAPQQGGPHRESAVNRLRISRPDAPGDALHTHTRYS